MKCRQALGAGAGALLSTVAARAAGRPAAPGERPNILWLVSEDNNPFIGAYGDPLAHTPQIDALARRGILYRNAYSNAPVCAPTRFTILTGINSESCGPAQHMRAKAHLPETLRTYPELLRAGGYYCTNNDKTDYNCDVEPERIWNEQGKSAHWRGRAAGQPFMSVFNFMRTHESRLFHRTDGKVQPEDVRLPAYLPDTPGIRQDYASYYNLIEEMDGLVGEKLAELEADGLADDTIVFYYSDNGGSLPGSKRYCHDEGLRCALVVHVPEKCRHLAPAGPGSTIDAPVSFVDLAPTLLSLAGQPIPATMQGAPFLGRAMVGPKPFAFGMRGRMDERIDMVRTVTDGRYRYVRNYLPYLPMVQYQAFAWQAQGYQDWDRLHREGRLNEVQARPFAPRPFEEFYDLSVDPDQIHNLAGQPAHDARMAEFSAALDAHIIAVNDNGFLPEGMAGEGWTESRVAGAYPLKQAMALARRAATGTAQDLPAFTDALASGDGVLRYWGAMGCVMLGEQSAGARTLLMKVMAADPSPHVRAAAAEAVARCCDTGTDRAAAIDVLAQFVGDEKAAIPIRLQALTALTQLGMAAKPALPAIRVAAASENTFCRSAGRYLAAVLEDRFDPAMKIFTWGPNGPPGHPE